MSRIPKDKTMTIGKANVVQPCRRCWATSAPSTRPPKLPSRGQAAGFAHRRSNLYKYITEQICQEDDKDNNSHNL